MRVFTGLPLPPAQIKKLTDALGYLKKTYPGLKTVKPDSLHITLHFFGELTEKEAEELGGIMGSRQLAGKKIDASFSSFGQFPKYGTPRVIFVDIDKGHDRVCSYFETYRKLVAGSGFTWTDDDRAFVPHITVARNQNVKLPPGYADAIPFTPGEVFPLDRCVLYQSVLKPTGAEYRALKIIMFE